MTRELVSERRHEERRGGADARESAFSRPARMARAVAASRRRLALLTRPRRVAPSAPTVVRATFHVPRELMEQARDAVCALSGNPTRLTLASLARHALEAELDRLRAAHNQGAPFPRRARELRGGRPRRG